MLQNVSFYAFYNIAGKVYFQKKIVFGVKMRHFCLFSTIVGLWSWLSLMTKKCPHADVLHPNQ